jgi:hypothetical protein
LVNEVLLVLEEFVPDLFRRPFGFFLRVVDKKTYSLLVPVVDIVSFDLFEGLSSAKMTEECVPEEEEKWRLDAVVLQLLQNRLFGFR